MLGTRRTRRAVAAALVILGGFLMALAPEILAGVVVLGVGVLVELAGIALEHKA